MTRLAVIALTLALTACGSGGEQPAAVNKAAAADDEYITRVRALTPAQRDGVLLRAVRDAGQSCQLVTRSTAIPDVGGAPAWVAHCDDDGAWVVAFNPGGIATVTSAPNPKGR